MTDQNQNDRWTDIDRRIANITFIKELAERTNYPIVTHAVNVLASEGIDTEEKFLKLTEWELRILPGLGKLAVSQILELQRLLRGDVDLREHLLQGLNDIASLVEDVPEDNEVALKVKKEVRRVLREYKKHKRKT